MTAGEERDPEAEQERVQPDVLPTNELTPAQNLSSPTSTPNSLSSDQPSQSRRLLQTLSQGASPASPQDRSLGAPSPATITGHPVDDLLLTSNSQKLLVYCKLLFGRPEPSIFLSVSVTSSFLTTVRSRQRVEPSFDNCR